MSETHAIVRTLPLPALRKIQTGEFKIEDHHGVNGIFIPMITFKEIYAQIDQKDQAIKALKQKIKRKK